MQGITGTLAIRWAKSLKVRPMCVVQKQLSAGLHRRLESRNQQPRKEESGEAESAIANAEWPRKIFSGIQPTGELHLGNYLGAVQKWTKLQEAEEDITLCIVDMHSITMPQNPPVLRENIFKMAATLLACGIDPTKATLFVQSAVVEHTEFSWILNCMTTLARLAHLPQFKEKSRLLKDVPLGLYVYPVLQAADIMLYKSTHVPVGVDQLQHIQLTQHLARGFNQRYGNTFPVCHALIDDEQAARIRSLRDPAKKMSKSDPDRKATINVCDKPDVIVDKIRKAMTDFTSDVSYDPINRPGVSNLLSMHSLITGTSVKELVEEAKTIDTGKYKMVVAEALVEHLKPIREKVENHLTRHNELIYLLEIGAEKARQTAQQTMSEVKQRLGLGIYSNMPLPADISDMQQSRDSFGPTFKQADGFLNINPLTGFRKDQSAENSEVRKVEYKPVVPMQKLRVEKKYKKMDYKMEDLNLNPVNTPLSPLSTLQKRMPKLLKEQTPTEKIAKSTNKEILKKTIAREDDDNLEPTKIKI